ncbi:hypothetical protein RJ641_004559 [Dillenia turbinata]|uniref:Uncharacterized protein n=1 Tax=Dillenia turbinata TaxID=194707 RepID=A0AAN8ZD28_9MAGN
MASMIEFVGPNSVTQFYDRDCGERYEVFFSGDHIFVKQVASKKNTQDFKIQATLMKYDSMNNLLCLFGTDMENEFTSRELTWIKDQISKLPNTEDYMLHRDEEHTDCQLKRNGTRVETSYQVLPSMTIPSSSSNKPPYEMRECNRKKRLGPPLTLYDESAKDEKDEDYKPAQSYTPKRRLG